MDYTNLPAKFPIVFAADAGGSYINPIPEASQISVTPGAASLTDGFPPLNFIPRGAGGVPPRGQDFNGILQQLSGWAQWQEAGGPVKYDSSFSTGIGGYPKGTVIAGNALDGTLYLNTADNNTTDPNGGGSANWTKINAYITGNNTTGTLWWPGTTGFKLKWNTVTVATPGSSSDLFTGGFAQTTAFAWDVAFSTICIGAWASYPLTANGNCTFGLANTTSLSGGNLYTTSGQGAHSIPGVVVFGFGI